MRSIKKFEKKKIKTKINSILGGATITGDGCIGYDRLKRNGTTITNTRDGNPFNNDRRG